MAVPKLIDALKRPSGAFAMLAIDQRESMRAMFGEYQKTPVSDQQLTEFKLAALRALSPLASAVLIDRQFAWRHAIDQHAVAPNCGLIAAADEFIPSAHEIVSDVVIDEKIDPLAVKADGALALKLLVLWRPDESAEKRKDMVRDFIGRCRQAGLLSIIEPVSRKPRDARPWDTNEGIQAAAEELGDLGADLYKAEVPLYGRGGESAVRGASARLNHMIQGPWVVLSSGVSPDDFPQAVEWACLEGARGFLAGRAVWRNVIGSTDIPRALIDDAAVRLQRLCDVVDRVVVPR